MEAAFSIFCVVRMLWVVSQRRRSEGVCMMAEHIHLFIFPNRWTKLLLDVANTVEGGQNRGSGLCMCMERGTHKRAGLSVKC